MKAGVSSKAHTRVLQCCLAASNDLPACCFHVPAAKSHTGTKHRKVHASAKATGQLCSFLRKKSRGALEASLRMRSYYQCNSKVYELRTQTEVFRETKVRRCQKSVIKDKTTAILNQPCKNNKFYPQMVGKTPIKTVNNM